ncbi:MAG: ribulose-phosphate 3-epimerase [Actinomycetota bacterium]|nr:ribulose-phosphate 3-epimerase [Actinomycetota bacterium]
MSTTETARDLFATRQIAPSILSADFARLGAQVAEVMEAGARVIHVDVMDGHFVPPITIGPMIAAALADQVHTAGGVLDVHLMIERPGDQVDAFAKAGADCITIHQEADPHAHRTLAAIREAGCLAGLAINPGTPVAAVAQLASRCDLLLAMTVNPGWGGQKFIASSLAKVEALSALAPEGCAIEVDGGVDSQTAPLVAGAGAMLLVAGSAVFGDPDPGAAFKRVAAAATG